MWNELLIAEFRRYVPPLPGYLPRPARIILMGSPPLDNQFQALCMYLRSSNQPDVAGILVQCARTKKVFVFWDLVWPA
jgi:hypothetical protein